MIQVQGETCGSEEQMTWKEDVKGKVKFGLTRLEIF